MAAIDQTAVRYEAKSVAFGALSKNDNRLIDHTNQCMLANTSKDFAMKRTVALVWCLLMMLGWIPISAAEQPGNCAELLAKQNNAQADYDNALSAWRQADSKISQAEREVAKVNDTIKQNDKAQIQLLRDLQAAEADQAACANASQNGPLAPLTDCSKVQSRIDKAQKDLAMLEEKNQQLEAELREKEQAMEDREDDSAKAHAAERAAWAALNKAKAAAAGCPKKTMA